MRSGRNNADADTKRLFEIFHMNDRFLRYVAAYLTNEPRLIEKKLMRALCSDGIDEELAFATVLAEAFGLDGQKSEEDRIIERRYLERSVRLLDISSYSENPYYKNIKPKPAKLGRWELKYEEFAPYEGFIYDDIKKEGLYEIPCIGFFNRTFTFPAVLEGEREWMMITPNEINTMKGPIERAKGKVLTYGLGMGYFAYMASLSDLVTSVTVVERDPQLIELFRLCILPLFENKEKINIVQSDAYEYARRVMPNEGFDYAFVDIWHDALDGLDLYVKMKKYEKYSPHTRFDYWAEDTLLCSLRRMVFEQIVPQSKDASSLNAPIPDYESLITMLSDSYLKKLAYDIKKQDHTADNM